MRSRLRSWLAWLAWAAVALLLPFAARLTASSALAQDPAPQVRFEDVLIGFDGTARSDQWYPISVTVSNDGPDIQAELVWLNEERSYRRAIDLPRGARKRLTILAWDAPGSRVRGWLSLRAAGNVLLEEQYRLTFVDSNVYTVGIIGDDPSLLNSLTALRPPEWDRVVVLRLRADQIPEQWPALMTLNALVVAAASDSWNDQQRAALETWVGLGGRLVIGGGVNADRITAGLGTLLPVTLEAGLSELPLQPLEALVPASSRAELPERLSTRTATPAPDAEVLAEGPLLVEQQRGAGKVVFASFDLAALRNWSGEAQLWERVLVFEQLRLLNNAGSLLSDVLSIPGLGLPSVWTLLAFLLTYVMLIGPVNYLVLRRLDKREWAWLTIPATVLLFAFGTYIVGFGLRGRSVLLNQVTVVRTHEGTERGAATTFVGMFSPRRGTYTIDLPANALVSEDDGSFVGEPLVPVWHNDRVSLPNVLIDVGALRPMTVESDTILPFRVSSNLREIAGQLEGELRVESGTVRDAILVRGEHAEPLGTLQAGESRSVTLPLNRNNFPWNVGVSSEGRFNRQQMLSDLNYSSVFGSSTNTSTPPVAGNQAAYLLAWVEEPLVPVTVENASAEHAGLTLYVIQLGAR